MKAITVKVQDTDPIVIDSLQEYYHLNNRWDKVDCSDTFLEPDFKVMEALLVVLEEYMSPEDFGEWYNDNPMKKESPNES